MFFVTFYIDGAEWFGGAKVFALTATYAAFFIYRRHLYRSSILGGIVNHQYSLCRALPCA